MQSNVTVNKSEILDILKTNRDNHIKIYNESIDGFKIKTREKFEEKLKSLADGKIDNLSINISKPENHAKDYDAAIRMIELHTNHTIELNSQDFNNLILDDWQWRRTWITHLSEFSNTAYVSGCALGYIV